MINLPTKFEDCSFTRYRDMKCFEKNAQMACLGIVRGDQISSPMSPFDRAHMTSYSSLLENMRLSCTVFLIQPATCRNSPTLPYPTCICRPGWGDYVGISKRCMVSEGDCETIRPPPLMWPGDVSYPSNGGVVACMQPVNGQ